MLILILSPEVSAQIAAGEAVVDNNVKPAERLCQAIPQRAFQGRLVPRDPADEPASALLERTRQAVGAQFIAPRTPGIAPRSAAPREGAGVMNHAPTGVRRRLGQQASATLYNPDRAPREGAGVMNHAPTGGKTRREQGLV